MSGSGRLIVCNPVAGRGARRVERTGGVVAALQRRLVEVRGGEVEVARTSGPREAVEIARARRGAVREVYVVGGDGTLREVVEGLGDAARDVTVGFVPMGNANVIARENRIPLRPAAAIEQAIVCRGRPIDAMLVRVPEHGERELLGLAMLGVGLDARVTRIVGYVRKQVAGRRLYARATGADRLYVAGFLRAWGRLGARELRVRGAELDASATHLWVCNTRCYSKGWAMAPEARADDGLLDVHACSVDGRWTALQLYGSALLRRRMPAAKSHYARAASWKLEAPRPFRWQLDGDPQPSTRALDVRVSPAHFKLVCPDSPALD